MMHKINLHEVPLWSTVYVSLVTRCRNAEICGGMLFRAAP